MSVNTKSHSLAPVSSKSSFIQPNHYDDAFITPPMTIIIIIIIIPFSITIHSRPPTITPS